MESVAYVVRMVNEKHMFIIYLYIFIYGLFEDAVSTSDYRAWNKRTIYE
jgi:hypothetical protein